MMISPRSLDLAGRIVQHCVDRQITLTTAESCTGGLVCGCLTAVPGASAVIDRGFVTYGYDAKHDLLKVPRLMLEQKGAVSPEVAKAMAEGARRAAKADVAIAITGIAGPGGGTPDKPVGLVHLAVADHLGTRLREIRLDGDRAAVRGETVEQALDLLLEALRGGTS